jgi:hypothetical protein
MVRARVREVCTYHEYRFSYGLAALAGIMTGLADAAIGDWAAKAFVWSGLLLLYALVVSYEFIVMPTPPRPLLQAFLFVLLAPMGLLSAHHFTWLIVSVMLGAPIDSRLWLAPNIYIDFHTYTVIAFAMLLAYFAALLTASAMSCEKEW